MTVRLIDLNNMIPLSIDMGISITKHKKKKQEINYRQNKTAF